MRYIFVLFLVTASADAGTPDERARAAIEAAFAQPAPQSWLDYGVALKVARDTDMPLVVYSNCEPEQVDGALVSGGSSCSHIASGPMVTLIYRNQVLYSGEPVAARGRIRLAIRGLFSPRASMYAARTTTVGYSAMGYSSGMMMRGYSNGYGGSMMRMGGYSGGMMMRSRASGGCSS